MRLPLIEILGTRLAPADSGCGFSAVVWDVTHSYRITLVWAHLTVCRTPRRFTFQPGAFFRGRGQPTTGPLRAFLPAIRATAIPQAGRLLLRPLRVRPHQPAHLRRAIFVESQGWLVLREAVHERTSSYSLNSSSSSLIIVLISAGLSPARINCVNAVRIWARRRSSGFSLSV